MSHFATQFWVILLAFNLGAGVSYGASKKKTPVGGTASDVISFDTGSSALSDIAKARLDNLISLAESGGLVVNDAKIAVWSDKTFPGGGAGLNKADRDLAKQRIDRIEEYLESNHRISDVEAFNMAKRSNWLGRIFKTDQAELKSLFSKEGGMAVNHEDFLVIKEKGDPSKAVVLVKFGRHVSPEMDPKKEPTDRQQL